MAPATKEQSASTEYADLEDHHLIGLYLERRDEMAFQELHRRYNSRLLSYATRKLGDRHQAEDVVAHVWRKITEHLHRIDPQEGRVSSYIWQALSNALKNIYRNNERDPMVDESTLTMNRDDAGDRPIEWRDDTMTPERAWEKMRARELVEEAVKRLPPHQRVVFVLFELKRWQYGQISEEVGIAKGTVKSRLWRARRAFASHVRKLQQESDTGRDEEPLVHLTETGVELIDPETGNGTNPENPDAQQDESEDEPVAPTAALTEREAREMHERARRELPPPGEDRTAFCFDLGRDYGVSRGTVHHVLRGEGVYSRVGLPDLLK